MKVVPQSAGILAAELKRFVTGPVRQMNRRTWLARALGGAGATLGSIQALQAAPESVPVPAPPTPAPRRWLVSPPGGALSLPEAVTQAADGDVLDLVPGEYRVAGLRLEGRKLTLRGAAAGVVFKGEGKPVKPRSLLSVQGGEVTLENLRFEGMRSEDGEGAGVRFDGGGRLHVRDCVFLDNEAGLAAGHAESAALTIERCQFGMAPRVRGGLHHLLDVGRIARLDITGTRLQQGFEGHLLRSRARESRIAWNLIVDGPRGGASYEVELPHGGLATLIGNIIGQGAESQNRVMVSYGSGDRRWERNHLTMAHNTLVAWGWRPNWFLRVHDDRLGAGTRVTAINNLLVGPGLFSAGVDGRFEGNRFATRGMLRDLDTYAFELPAGSAWRGSGVDPRNIDGQDLSPKNEFVWPYGFKPIAPEPTSWTPGAFQR